VFEAVRAAWTHAAGARGEVLPIRPANPARAVEGLPHDRCIVFELPLRARRYPNQPVMRMDRRRQSPTCGSCGWKLGGIVVARLPVYGVATRPVSAGSGVVGIVGYGIPRGRCSVQIARG
jgi:hypothetical protein